MKPTVCTFCLLQLARAAELVRYSLYLATRRRGLLLPSERIAEATTWQRERLFWGRCYRHHMAALISPLS